MLREFAAIFFKRQKERELNISPTHLVIDASYGKLIAHDSIARSHFHQYRMRKSTIVSIVLSSKSIGLNQIVSPTIW
jgi:hypothetical protein